ncbi:MAG: hypothetical protein JWR61_2853 [Ferruginibacter sp.]|nr:hypothetical protein [Ferruginibacter sp.]
MWEEIYIILEYNIIYKSVNNHVVTAFINSFKHSEC